MSGARLDCDSEPRIELEQVSARRNGELWTIAWSVKNSGSKPLRVLAARLPHGQFKSEENRFEPPLDLKPGEQRRIQTLVRCEERPGPVTDNAFVIFYVRLNEPWRLFARISLTVGPEGKPRTKTESITAQQVGFSQSHS